MALSPQHPWTRIYMISPLIVPSLHPPTRRRGGDPILRPLLGGGGMLFPPPERVIMSRGQERGDGEGVWPLHGKGGAVGCVAPTIGRGRGQGHPHNNHSCRGENVTDGTPTENFGIILMSLGPILLFYKSIFYFFMNFTSFLEWVILTSFVVCVSCQLNWS